MRRPTIADIARRAGVTKAAVSALIVRDSAAPWAAPWAARGAAQGGFESGPA